MTGAHPAYERLLAWCRNERASLEQQLTMLKAGTLTTRQHVAGKGMVDPTPDSIRRVEESIAELDGILARGDQG